MKYLAAAISVPEIRYNHIVDTKRLQAYLADLNLEQVAYFSILDSTNTQGMRLVEQGAPHLSLVVADQQTAGKGRGDRSWQTLPGAAIAFSLIIYPNQNPVISTSRLTGLGALAVCDVLKSEYKLPAKIKWPNDVLIAGSKLAGVLVEAQWQGDEIQAAVLGIGINVARKSIPSQGELDFPASSVESVYGEAVDRWMLLKKMLEAILDRLPQLNQDRFIADWQANLAYRGSLVQILREGAEPISGRIQGLNDAGYLRIELASGEKQLIRSGDVKLRQVDRT